MQFSENSRLRLSAAVSWMTSGDDLLLVTARHVVRLPRITSGPGGLFKEIAPRLDGTLSIGELSRQEGIPLDLLCDLLAGLHGDGILEHVADATVTAEALPSSDALLITIGDSTVSCQLADHLQASRLVSQSNVHRAPRVAHDEVFCSLLEDYWSRGTAAPTSALIRDPDAARAFDRLLEPLSGEYELAVIISDSPYSLSQLLVAQSAMLCGKPHLLVSVTGNMVHLGPTVVPGETACAYCRLRRHLANSDVGSAAVLDPEYQYQSPEFAPGLPGVAWGYLESELHLLRVSPAFAPTTGTQIDIGIMPRMINEESVWRIPGCPFCALADGDRRVRVPFAPYSAADVETQT